LSDDPRSADPVTGHNRPVVLVPGRAKRSKRDRILTFRVVLFVVLLVGVIGGTGGLVLWFNQSSYFVGLNAGRVAVYLGRPGGMLWFKPRLIETSAVRTSDLLPSSISALQSGISESSLKAADTIVTRLKNEKENAIAATTTTTTTTTTTLATTTTSTFPLQTTTSAAPATSPTTQPVTTTTHP
jgi:nitrate reductase NapE component